MTTPLWLLATAIAILAGIYLFVPPFAQVLGAAIGKFLKRKNVQRRELLLARARIEKRQFLEYESRTTLDDEWEKIDRSRSSSSSDLKVRGHGSEWDGIVGFFHPFCNAGGGGERVLWAAIHATQEKWPNALCAVYTGDHEVTKEQILKRVKERFNIQLNSPMVTFLYLSTRDYVLSSTWPHFTLFGQSVGSLLLAHDAFSLLVPDIFIDTMGYAFTMPLCKFLFPNVPTGAYVHYPTISTDMLDSLNDDSNSGKGLNAGAGTGWKGILKQRYWQLFAHLYSWAGGSIDVVVTNSSWTQGHIDQLWSKSRKLRNKQYPIEVLFPPVAVEELRKGIEISKEGEKTRTSTLLYIAQFRLEKNHTLILQSFGHFLKKSFPASLSSPRKKSGDDKSQSHNSAKPPSLVLIGSVRDTADEKYIYSLRLLAHELHITEHVTFLLNAPWDAVLSQLRTASVGVNGMWNEHFGIGVVEYQAAGLIGVVHNSGGPKKDIVVDMPEGEGGSGPTGLHATSIEEFSAGFEKVLLGMGEDERWQTRLRARRSAQRFSSKEFDERWLVHMGNLVTLRHDMNP